MLLCDLCVFVVNLQPLTFGIFVCILKDFKSVLEQSYMKIKILFHNNCFDGVASAALFAAFYRESVNKDAQQVFEGLAHKAGQVFDEAIFDGDENAIVDFKYSSSPRLTWWFDHHQSPFLTGE